MSLLTLAPRVMTGTATYVRALIEELSRGDSSVRLTVLANAAVVDQVERWCSPPTRVRGLGMKLPEKWPRMATILSAELAALCRAGTLAPEGQLVHWPLTIPLPHTRLPTVQTLHDVLHCDRPEFFSSTQRQWRRLAYDAPARRATLVITVSEHSRERIVEHIGVPPERIHVIPHGVDTRRFYPSPAVGDDTLLAPLDLPERFVLYPAALWPHKNHRRLLEAVANLDASNLTLVLCGPEVNGRLALEGQIQRLGLQGRVRLLGFVDNDVLPALYRRAIATVFPTLYEGFGVPILEAMACGCPVAASSVRPVDEICGNAAILFDPEDVCSIAEGIQVVVEDRAVRERLRVTGLKRASHATWGEVARLHSVAYKEALTLAA